MTIAADVPAHVPPELVFPYALSARKTVYINPHEELIPPIHELPPVFWVKDVYVGATGGWVVRRADELRTVYSDCVNFIKRGNTGFAAMIGESWDIIPTELDPPRHTAFRNVLNPIFTPKRMAELDEKVRQRAREFIARFKDRGECDFVEEFAVPFPVSIFLELLGLPQENMKQFLQWEYELLHTPDMQERGRGTLAVKAYLLEAIAERKKKPTDDLISNALRLEVDGRKWTDEEIFGHCFNLYIGGLDTVSSNMGLHFRHLATRPEHQRELREHPDRIPIALEELLRAYAAVTTNRIVDREIEIGGVKMQPGDKVAMATPLAARDPEAYDKPNEVRFDRRPAHLTFGFGPHRCLGVHLARRELQVALQEVLTAIPEFHIRDGFNVPFYVGNILHVESLPLVWKN
jgi:cytochrome P450